MNIDYQPMEVYELNDSLEGQIPAISDSVERLERIVPYFFIVPVDEDERPVMAVIPQLMMPIDDADQKKMMRYFGMKYGLDGFAVAYVGIMMESTRWEMKSAYEKKKVEDGIDCVVFAAMSVDSKNAVHVMDVSPWDGNSREILNEMTILFDQESEGVVSTNRVQLESFMQGYILARMARNSPAARARIEKASAGALMARTVEDIKKIIDDLIG